MTGTSHTLATLRPQLPTYPVAAVVFVGDVIVLFAFVAYGLYSHGMLAWEQPTYTLLTFAPFLIAWLVIAPFVNLYRRDTLGSYRLTLGFVVVGWVGVTLLGSLIRATPFFHGGTSGVFLLVTLGFGLLFFLPWRLGVVAVRRWLAAG